MSDLRASVNTAFDLRQHTPARVSLGRVGSSLPTSEVLNLSMAHARARDAVHLPLATAELSSALRHVGFPTQRIRSQAPDRAAYLRRPDLGRRLDTASRDRLSAPGTVPLDRLTVIVADGLSSLATMRHAVPVLLALRDRLQGWSLDTIFLATQARVALSDEVGSLRQARAAIILLGERPGLSSPDSLGVYLTYSPRPGRSDAERNCISNIHGNGLSYAEAAFKLGYLLEECRLAGASGLGIKDNSTWTTAQGLLP